MKNDYYSGTYIPGIVKWGKITLLLAFSQDSFLLL